MEVLEGGFTQRRKVRKDRKQAKVACQFELLCVLAALRELF
jgi:hypothetical protein